MVLLNGFELLLECQDDIVFNLCNFITLSISRVLHGTVFLTDFLRHDCQVGSPLEVLLSCTSEGVPNILNGSLMLSPLLFDFLFQLLFHEVLHVALLCFLSKVLQEVSVENFTLLKDIIEGGDLVLLGHLSHFELASISTDTEQNEKDHRVDDKRNDDVPLHMNVVHLNVEFLKALLEIA